MDVAEFKCKHDKARGGAKAHRASNGAIRVSYGGTSRASNGATRGKKRSRASPRLTQSFSATSATSLMTSTSMPCQGKAARAGVSPSVPSIAKCPSETDSAASKRATAVDPITPKAARTVQVLRLQVGPRLSLPACDSSAPSGSHRGSGRCCQRGCHGRRARARAHSGTVPAWAKWPRKHGQAGAAPAHSAGEPQLEPKWLRTNVIRRPPPERRAC